MESYPEYAQGKRKAWYNKIIQLQFICIYDYYHRRFPSDSHNHTIRERDGGGVRVGYRLSVDGYRRDRRIDLCSKSAISTDRKRVGRVWWMVQQNSTEAIGCVIPNGKRERRIA